MTIPNGRAAGAARSLVRTAVLGLAAVLAAAGAVTAQAPAERTAAVLDVTGAIGPATTEQVRRGLAEARQRDAAVLVLRIDTPGGLESAMRDIVRAILESPIPVIGYVAPSGARAASAGTYILYASHLAAMAPSTHLGAATPVQIGGQQRPGQDAQPDPRAAKAMNDAVAYLRGLADLRGRSADFAERAVRDAATLTAGPAREQGVVEIVAGSITDLLAQADGRTVRLPSGEATLRTAGLAVVEIGNDWRTRILQTITDPNIAYILLLVGFYGLLFEFFSPGAIVPGVLGAIAFLVGLYALNLMPLNYAGVALLLLGIALMVAEAFAPSFGALGIGGIVAFALGSLFLFEDVPGFAIDWPVIGLATAATALFLILALAAAWRAHRGRVATGEAAMIGSAGEVLAWSGDHGDVRVHGERWRAYSAAPLAPGQRVRVVARRDLTLLIEPEAPRALPPT